MLDQVALDKSDAHSKTESTEQKSFVNTSELKFIKQVSRKSEIGPNDSLQDAVAMLSGDIS